MQQGHVRWLTASRRYFRHDSNGVTVTREPSSLAHGMILAYHAKDGGARMGAA
jgi:hypothetical protein